MKLPRSFIFFVSMTLAVDVMCTDPKARPDSYEARYSEWRVGLQQEIDAGRSWVSGNKELLTQLGKTSRGHEKFLLKSLKADPFVVLVLEASDTLSEREKKEYPAGLEARQVFWIGRLEKAARNEAAKADGMP